MVTAITTRKQQGIDRRMKQRVMTRCMPYVQEPSALDLGYVDSMWSDALLARSCHVDIIEGALLHVEHAHRHHHGRDDVRIYHARFEDYVPDCRYDTVIAGDMIRYLHAPSDFLSRAGGWLNPGGRIIITVPNGLSLHRRFGTLMGMEEHPMALNRQDRIVGNLTTNDRYTLRQLVLNAGLELLTLRGCLLKPVDSARMTDWPDGILSLAAELATAIPDRIRVSRGLPSPQAHVVPKDNALISCLKPIIEKNSGKVVLAQVVMGHCDMRHFKTDNICLYGPGAVWNAHGVNECYRLSDMEIVARNLIKFAMAWCGAELSTGEQ